MLPKGYCPIITNGMVRRERAVRKLRGRVIIDDFDSESAHGRIYSWASVLKQRLFSSGSKSPSSAQKGKAVSRSRSRQKTQTQTPSQQSGDAAGDLRQRMRELAGPDIDEDHSDDGHGSRCEMPFQHNIRWGKTS